MSFPLPCRLCGCVPAVQTTFRGHQGMLVLARFLRTSGPFCRDCGLATFRQLTARSLVQGWYSYASLFVNPATVLLNVVRSRKVAALPAPQPAPDGLSRVPIDPGRPLLLRPTAVIGLCIPFALAALLMTIGRSHG